MEPIKSKKKQQGVAIIMALFILALVATLSVVMMSRVERDTRRTQLLLRYMQAESYAQGSVAWAIDQLRLNWKGKRLGQQLIDKTPFIFPVKEVNGYRIQSTIYDMQGRFNLNNLTDPDAQTSFKKLLHLVLPTLTDAQLNAIVAATVNWISPGGQRVADDVYLRRSPPYRVAHRLLTSRTEFRLVQGVTPTLYAALEPYITALPTTTLTNVQSASAPVLAALSPNLSLDAATAIVARRAENPFNTVEKFLNLDLIKNNPSLSQKITVMSSYFLVQSEVTIEDQTLVLYTLLERSLKDGKPILTMLWQSKGTW